MDGDMIAEKVHFFNEHGQKLTGVLYSPEGSEYRGKTGAMVLCPGFAGLKEMFLPDIASYLIKSGYVAMSLDYRGFGESEGERWCLLPLEQVNDVISAVSFLEARPEVDGEKIGVMGFSFGGGNAVCAAATDTRIRCMISVMGVGNGEAWLRSLRRDESEWQQFLKRLGENRARHVRTGKSECVDPLEIYTLDPDTERAWTDSLKLYPERAQMEIPLLSAEAILRFKPEEAVDKISPRASLFVSAGDDKVVPLAQQVAMFQRCGDPKQHEVIHGASHQDLYRKPRLRNDGNLHQMAR